MSNFEPHEHQHVYMIIILFCNSGGYYYCARVRFLEKSNVHVIKNPLQGALFFPMTAVAIIDRHPSPLSTCYNRWPAL